MSDDVNVIYTEKLQKLFDEMTEAGGDPINMVMSWVSGYVEAATEGEQEPDSSGDLRMSIWLSVWSRYLTNQSQLRGCTNGDNARADNCVSA